MQSEQPDAVILAAAKVDGIHANNAYPADFIYQNLMIECNVLHQAFEAGVTRLLQLGCSESQQYQPWCHYWRTILLTEVKLNRYH